MLFLYTTAKIPGHWDSTQDCRWEVYGRSCFPDLQSHESPLQHLLQCLECIPSLMQALSIRPVSFKSRRQYNCNHKFLIVIKILCATPRLRARSKTLFSCYWSKTLFLDFIDMVTLVAYNPSPLFIYFCFVFLIFFLIKFPYHCVEY